MKNANRVALVLAIILIAASLLFVYGGSNNRAQPSTVNTRGLGLAAFGELLKQSGLPLQQDRSAVLNPGKNDLLILTNEDGTFNRIFGRETDADTIEPPVPEELSEEIAPPARKPREQVLLEQSIERHLKQGGRVLTLEFLSLDNRVTPKPPVTLSTVDKSKSFRVALSDDPFFFTADDIAGAIPLIGTSAEFHTYLIDHKPGVEMVVTDATFLRNRFIAKEQNAELGLWLVQKFLPPGGNIIFAEASAGNVEQRGALDELGKWAPAALWQFLITLGVALFTLNRRFGIPSREITKARGVKELMSAMSLTLQRANRHDHALLILRSNAIDQVRRTLRLSAGMSEAEVISRMHPDAQAIMANIIRLQGQYIPKKDAVNMAHFLEQHLKQMEFEEKARRAPQ